MCSDFLEVKHVNSFRWKKKARTHTDPLETGVCGFGLLQNQEGLCGVSHATLKQEYHAHTPTHNHAKQNTHTYNHPKSNTLQS